MSASIMDNANGLNHSTDNTAPTVSRKPKGKRMPDASEVGKALAAKINQLELDAAGEKDQEMEIEREVKKATRDLSHLLNQMDTPMSKLEALHRKYSDLLSDMKRTERENAKNKKRADLYQKEKDSNRVTLTKTETVKAKLETLCRELQRDNKKLKDEQKRIESDERTSREELSDRADTLFWELNESMSRIENPQESAQSQDADELFRQKFKTFIEQYELRELHVLSMMKTKDSEVQLHVARAEEYRKRAEKESSKSQALNTQVATFSSTETELRSQLNIYVEKFKQVEDTLNNSNDLFLTFRKEMEEMSKKTKRLEKENLNLTRKHDLTNRNILEMAEERTKINKEMEVLRKKNTTLESVIRRMQDQGRASKAGMEMLMADAEGTESEYDDDDEYDEEEEEGSEQEGEYDEEAEAELISQQQQHQRQQQHQHQQQLQGNNSHDSQQQHHSHSHSPKQRHLQQNQQHRSYSNVDSSPQLRPATDSSHLAPSSSSSIAASQQVPLSNGVHRGANGGLRSTYGGHGPPTVA